MAYEKLDQPSKIRLDGPISSELYEKVVEAKTWLYNAEIFRGYYGWKPCNSVAYEEQWFANNLFDPNEIGRTKYNAAHVAVKKACDRLEKRGLVECIRSYSSRSWAAVVITKKGIDLMAKLGTKVDPQISH